MNDLLLDLYDTLPYLLEVASIVCMFLFVTIVSLSVMRSRTYVLKDDS